ncbi:hypothetical protein [Sphingobium indicum]|uniref:hypothetical protein n=1 Tax=Sphingobium indicum TaxID=332055 RepID=UPI0012DC3163|nr:hypothetical protein [Sphingobium indicum]
MSGCLRIGLPIIILTALGTYSAFPHPTHDQANLKAIAAESQSLMAAHPISAHGQSTDIPKDQWPPAIAELEPYSVTVYYGSLHIGTRPFFDGGWGYGFAPDKRNLGWLSDCWSELNYGLFWHGPC